MYKHILVALDDKPQSEQALKHAIALAKMSRASLTGISVIEKLPSYAALVGEVEEMKTELEKFFGHLQSNALKAAEASGVTMKTIIKAGRADQVIIRYAEENGVDLIVIGAEENRGLGGTADKVTENAACSVLIARLSLPSIKVRDAMTREVTTVSPATPLAQVVRLFIEQGFKATPVVERGKVIGMITGGDLLTRAGMGLRISMQRVLPNELLAEYLRQLAEEGKTARDVMTSPVVTIRDSENVTKAAVLMSEKNIKRLPVLNQQGELVGIISRLDILALAASVGPSAELFPALGGETARTAGDIMFRDVPTVDPEASLSEVVQKILSTPLRRVVVIDESRHVLGIIVDKDLIKATQAEKARGLLNIFGRLSAVPVQVLNLTDKASHVMTREVYSVHPDTALTDVIQMMIDKRVKRLVVMDDGGRLLGMVSRESILRLLAGKL